MAFEILLVFGLILLAMVLFSMDSVPFDLVAMILMSSLMLTGVIGVQEGLSGFSNPATVTIAAMFALSKGIQNTGILRIVSRYFSKIGRLSLPTAVVIIMGIIALISSFINNVRRRLHAAWDFHQYSGRFRKLIGRAYFYPK